MEHLTNSGEARNYVCSCGKDYLSYAALFTHVKQKHEGKAPGPIRKPPSERKRGRPRKNAESLHQTVITLENRISILNEINKIVRQEQEIKSKRAVIMLDCGSFQGFQVYEPDIYNVSNIAAYNYPIFEKNEGNFLGFNLNEKEVYLNSSLFENSSNENHESEEALIESKESEENMSEFKNIFENTDLHEKIEKNKMNSVEEDGENRSKAIKQMNLQTEQAAMS